MLILYCRESAKSHLFRFVSNNFTNIVNLSIRCKNYFLFSCFFYCAVICFKEHVQYKQFIPYMQELFFIFLLFCSSILPIFQRTSAIYYIFSIYARTIFAGMKINFLHISYFFCIECMDKNTVFTICRFCHLRGSPRGENKLSMYGHGGGGYRLTMKTIGGYRGGIIMRKW